MRLATISSICALARLAVLDPVLDEARALAGVVEAAHVDVAVLVAHRAAGRLEVAAPAVGDVRAIGIDRERVVFRVVRARVVRLVEPVADQRRPAALGLIVRVIPVLDVLAEQRPDLSGSYVFHASTYRSSQSWNA